MSKLTINHIKKIREKLVEQAQMDNEDNFELDFRKEGADAIDHLYSENIELKSEKLLLKEKLKAKESELVRDVLIGFVSDTNETGQFSWSDCQWLDDWKYEWLESNYGISEEE